MEEDASSTSEQHRGESDREPPQKRGGKLRLLILLPAALLVAAALLLAMNWTAIVVRVNPLWALKSAAERVMELPEPLSMGFLGEVTVGKLAVNCSGVVDAQTNAEGLTLSLEDCTVGSDEGGLTLSLYLSPREAAACVPALTGGDEGWYGVSLTQPIADQAAGTGGEAAYGWYFSQKQMDKLQEAADQTREALKGVKTLTGDREMTRAVRDFLTQAEASGTRTPGGYTLSFFEDDHQRIQALCQALELPEELLTGAVTVDFGLTKEGTLQRIAVDSWNLDIALELGEVPSRELTPRLEGQWLDGKGVEYTLTLALTVDRGQPLTPPEYQNAFSLLPRF